MNEKNAVAQTILQQLGGRRFCMMTGAKDLIAFPQGLGFRLPKGTTKNKATHITILHTFADDYTVNFNAARGSSVRLVSTHDGIYADQLADLVADQTGLALTL